ncbi:MAG: hypothetical protein GC172_01320 [Phycisphaera sp.]|nr:hypothetical protein [Phycisphaera sp.]
MNLFGGEDRGHGPQRMLVRVLLALRCEARRSPDPAVDRLRAEQLADRIIAELPRSVLPLGIAALLVVAVVCIGPLARDAVTERKALVGPTPVATVVEAGIREQGAALQDGFATIRAIVEPFAGSGSAPADGASAGSRGFAPCSDPPCDAAAPFPRS